MSRYGFGACSCGSSMLKPTESPPPSLGAAVRRLHHARAAAGDDREPGLGQQPADRARLLVRRRRPRRSAPSRRRSPPGRDPCRPPRSPRGTPRRSSRCASRGRRRRVLEDAAVCPRSEPVLRDVARRHAEHEQHREADVERRSRRVPGLARADAVAPSRIVCLPAGRAPDRAAVEEADRDQVEEVEQEARRSASAMEERESCCSPIAQHERGADAPPERPGERDPEASARGSSARSRIAT